MQSNILKKIVLNVINKLQGQDVVCYDVQSKSNITDIIIICTGISNRHVTSISQYILYKSRAIGFKPYSVEGMKYGEWVLVDLGDVVVHVMQKEIRKLYELEKLWG